MNRLDWNRVHYCFDREVPPAMSVESGATVTLRTERADCMMLSPERPVFKDRTEVVESNPNPVTGPIFVDGARPGEHLRVSILSVIPCPDESLGYVTYVPGPSALVPPFSLLRDLPPKTLWVRLENGEMELALGGKPKRIPALPMIGTIGTAPKEERLLTYWSGREHCGNIDCALVCAGNEVVLPVNVEGALLSLGDVHARQGDGEVSCCAVECRGEVVIRVDVLKAADSKYYEWPQVNGPAFIGSVGCVRNSMEKTVEAALFDLVKRVELHYGYSTLDAYELVAQCVELKICQAVFPHFACVAMIERRFL